LEAALVLLISQSRGRLPKGCFGRLSGFHDGGRHLVREVMLTHASRAPVSGAKGAGGTCCELTINSGRGLVNIAHNLAIF
jgi:hypothetical protein